MYKARVDAISGTKILASGKWLQCIGNKNFRVGELAWTDGRCAYGNHYTPQQPLVITAPTQDEGIPMMFYEWSDESRYNWNDELYEALVQDDDGSFPYLYAGRTFRKRKLSKVIMPTPRKKRCWMINDYRGNVNTFKDTSYAGGGNILAANIDKRGNIFTLEISSFKTISIKKNSETLLFFDCPQGTNLKPFVWGFIENAENWAIKAHVVERTEEIGVDTLADHVCRYITTSGSEGVKNFTFKRFETLSYEPEDNTPIKLPLQDGYYYVAVQDPVLIKRTSPVGLSGSHTSVKIQFCEERTIYSPQGEKLFTGTLDEDSYMTITKVPGGYLLRVDATPINRPAYTGEGFPAWTYYDISIENNNSPYIDGGLYFLKDGEVSPLLNISCRNQRLRPMPKYKNWQNRIRDLPTE